MGWIIMRSTRATQNVTKYLVPLAAQRLDDQVAKVQERVSTQMINPASVELI